MYKVLAIGQDNIGEFAMYTNIEFLDEEPIENVVTSLNYAMDKVVFFGYKETVSRQKAKTESFLKSVCGVDTVEFVEISHSELGRVREQLKNYIITENDAKNRVYIDVTGGESIVLVALGMIAEELNLPIHMYDIETGKLTEFEKESGTALSVTAPQRKISLNLEKYIKMQGCKINRQLHKEAKDADGEVLESIEKICTVFITYSDKWNYFSRLLREEFIPDDDMKVRASAKHIIEVLKQQAGKKNIKNIKQLNEIFTALNEAGAVLDFKCGDGKYYFRYSSRNVHDLLCEDGSILELHTYHTEKDESDDCMVGVHIDWDGVIHQQPTEDVLNEIDVLKLNGYIPTFISCKSGKMDGNQALYAMYELETVASRFGGRYARKVLVISRNMSDIYKDRAREMGIEVREIKR
jgi:hypothetical protein